MTFSLAAWEIDAAIVTITADALHRLAARAFVQRPNAYTGRALGFAHSLSRVVTRLTASPRFAHHSLNR